MNPEPDGYHWPEEPAPELPGPGVILLVVLYTAPIVLLLLFPAIAWIALLPLSLVVFRTSHGAHRRYAGLLYLGTGLFSFAPWIAMLFD